MTDTQDTSCRFIAEAGSPLVPNLAALWLADPQLARKLDASESKSPLLVVETARSGDPTLKADLGERSLHLHSRFNPADEARRKVDRIDCTQQALICCYGFGLGYEVDELFKRTGDGALICIFEPDLGLLRMALALRDFSKLIKSKRVMWFCADDKTHLFNRLMPWQSMVTLNVQHIPLEPAVQLSPGFHERMRTYVDEFAAYAHTNIATLVLNGKRTAENIARNLAWYVRAPGVERLAGRHRGQPAIIVSAGPSLRKNQHLLPRASRNAVMIAVQTTLRPLLDQGVEPDFVTSLDYHDISTRFWENLPANLRTELVAEPKAANAVLEMCPGPISLLGNEFAENMLRELSINKMRLRSGATVAHLAYYLAEHMGCDPIIFVGQDLGFSDGLCYTPGTSYEDVWRPELSRFCTVEMKQWEQIVRDRPILRQVPDQLGRPMYTEQRLFTYLQHFERDFAATRTRIIDATEGGARKRGATSMTLADALGTYCQTPIARSSGRDKYAGADSDRTSQAVAALRNRKDEAGRIAAIAAETLGLLEALRDNLSDQTCANRLISRIDALRARMAELDRCYGLVMQLTQKSELTRFRADQRILASRLDGIDLQRQQVQRDIENVRSVIDACELFDSLVDNTIERLGEQVKPQVRREAA